MRRLLSKPGIIILLIAVVCVAAISSAVYAAGPRSAGEGANKVSAGTAAINPQSQDPTWLAQKNAYQIMSGVTTNITKGSPLVAPHYIGCCGIFTPSASELPVVNQVPWAFEPGDGNHPNFGPNSAHTDDANKSYNDHDFYDLCGPGAANIALYYWPWPASTMGPVNVTDGSTGLQTTWNAERLRGYLVHLAWQIQWPGWPHPGMMDTSKYPSLGVTLYGMMDALNWEASGENSTTWSTYYYTIHWWSQESAAILNQDVVFDVYNNHVPVVAEVNASLLPNWPASSTKIFHFVTIIGYDNNAHTYTYTDTCGNSTACGSKFDGGIHTVSQSQMWNAITSLPTNMSTDPSGGDGGWVW